MGRSRAIARSADNDPNHSKGKRKKTVISSNVEKIETESTSVYEEAVDGKKALYHCNYCNKDISGTIRIKCAICPDFDLCIECFCVGAQITPHKCNHPYRVMDNLCFPLICTDWNADEEMLLLEGIEMYGFGNWMEVSEHVGTKSKSQCIDHYNAVYMNSPCFPIPDMSHVMGKSRDELLAMAKEHAAVKKESPSTEELIPKDESFSTARIQNEAQKQDLASQSSSALNEGSCNTSGATKKAHNVVSAKDDMKVEAETQSDRRIGEKKPRFSAEEGPPMTEFSGYNFKREEFEVEHDNDAEQLLADMEFKDTDTHADQEMKLQVLRIYSTKLDERKRRRDFILKRNLIYPNLFEKNLSPEEKEIYQRFKVYMRYHSKEEHEEMMRSIILELHITKRIQDLQEARAAGCLTSSEVNQFFEQKQRKEAEEISLRTKDSPQVGSGGKVLPRSIHLKGEVEGSPRGVIRSPSGLNSSGREPSSILSKPGISNSLDDWDLTGFLGADLLSESEKHLCEEIKILPAHYLNMVQTISVGVAKGKITNKSDAHNLFNVEASKVERVYDMVVEKGIAQA